MGSIFTDNELLLLPEILGIISAICILYILVDAWIDRNKNEYNKKEGE